MIRPLLLALASLIAIPLSSTDASAGTLPRVAPVTSCASLRSFNPGLKGLPTQITDAVEETSNGVAVCRVSGVISPQIRFEVRLPTTVWTQRLLEIGCGGLCGEIRTRAPQRACPVLQRGEFVTAATDMGHSTRGGVWGASDQQLRVDFGYRGIHGTALIAKALITRFYGQAPRFSYFSGCSDGGREALMEAQRFPQDFDGIAAGAPAMNFLVQNVLHHGWQARTVAPDGRRSLLVAEDMPALHAAVLAACDAKDGVADGIVSDPFGCRVDAAAISCSAARTSGCLPPAKAAVAAEIYRGAHDRQGRRLVVGGLMPGSELAWPGVALPGRPGQPGGPPANYGGAPGGLRQMLPESAPVVGGRPTTGPVNLPAGVPGSTGFASDAIQYLAFPITDTVEHTLANLAFDEGTLKAFAPMHGIYDATNPDLSGFEARRGKLIVWHGLQDQHISPANTAAYAQAVSDRMGEDAAARIMRTFLIPGMYHCQGGDGLTSIDVLTPLMAWVEDGTAPDSILASKSDTDASEGKGRPIPAFPRTLALGASADPDRPGSWMPSKTFHIEPRLYAAWLGADLYRPAFFRQCGFDGERYVCVPATTERH